MIGTSARPLSVSVYSTRGGTSGNVWRATMPSSSSARSRSESVRGEMPSSERSSSQKRERCSARSRITRSVHFPQTMSAVRQTGQSEFGIRYPFYRKASLTEVCGDLTLVGAAHDREREGAARLERVEQLVVAAQRPLACRDQQVARLEPRLGGGAVRLDPPDQQPLALGEA